MSIRVYTTYKSQRRRRPGTAYNGVQKRSEGLIRKVLLCKIKELNQEKNDLEIEQYQQARLYKKKQFIIEQATGGPRDLKRSMEEDAEEWKHDISAMERTTSALQKKSKKALQETNHLSATINQLEKILSNTALATVGEDDLRHDICLHQTLIANQDAIIKSLRKQIQVLNNRYDKKDRLIARKTHQTLRKTSNLRERCKEYKNDISKLDKESANRSIYCQQHQRLYQQHNNNKITKACLPAPKRRLAIRWKEIREQNLSMEEEISNWLKDIKLSTHKDAHKDPFPPRPARQSFKNTGGKIHGTF